MDETVRIASLGGSGDGLAEPDGGGPLFVPYALPGEQVVVARQGERARLVAVVEASPERAVPFCPVFGLCGGCVAQHMAPDLYAGWKRQRVVEALGRAGLPTSVEPLVDAHGEGRRRLTLHGRLVEGRMRVGFMEARSHRLVEVADCPVAAPALREAPKAAAALARLLAGIGKPLDIAVTGSEAGLDIDLRGAGRLPEPLRQRLILQAGELDLARLSNHGELLIERRPPAVSMGPARCVPPPGAFLQATAAGEAALAAEVAEGVGGARRVLDLFAGAGPLTLRLAARAEIHAVEAEAAMLAALERAAHTTPGLRQVTTEARDLFRRPLLPPELERFDAVVLDPPRAGAEAQVRHLIPSSQETVIMVSCDPMTFARDAAALVAGGFSLERVVPVDQFKWSQHVEIVGRFRRPRSGTARRGRRRLGQG